MQTITVKASRTYQVHIGTGLLDRAGELSAPLFSGRRAVIVSDSNVWPLYGARVLSSLERAGFQAEPFVFPAGEASKNPQTLLELISFLAGRALSRSDGVFALGGGVTGDMAGLAAALYLRGVPCVQLPTSLLAVVDSSVGGKTAVDLPAGKNLVGSFYQPHLVLIDPDTRATLPPRELSGGMGEVIKYAATFDRDLWPLLEDTKHLEQVVLRCLDLKRQVVQRDELDTGERMLLNFGHTLGHAIEKAQNFEGYIHGEAVAAGMCLMTRITQARGITREGDAQRLEDMCRAWNLPVTADKALWPAMAPALDQDKKHLAGGLTVVALEELGRGKLMPCPPHMLEEVVSWLR